MPVVTKGDILHFANLQTLYKLLDIAFRSHLPRDSRQTNSPVCGTSLASKIPLSGADDTVRLAE